LAVTFAALDERIALLAPFDELHRAFDSSTFRQVEPVCGRERSGSPQAKS